MKVLCAILLSALTGCMSVTGTPAPTSPPPASLILATTTSTQDSGLLDAILPVFERGYNAKVKVVAVGTGQALKLGADGNADVVLVHARKQEDEFVANGDGINRRDVMYNDFVLVGPPNDLAKISGLKLAADAFKQIAQAQSPFASRGDKSGTNTKELEIWQTAGIQPQGAWYLSVGQGMGETLTFANEKSAYTLSDRATFLAQQARLSLAILVGGSRIEENADPSLYNPYGVIPINPAKHPNVNYALAEQFARWITASETQKLIATFGVDKYGQSLFRPQNPDLNQLPPQAAVDVHECTKQRLYSLIDGFVKAYNDRDMMGVLSLFSLNRYEFQYFDDLAGKKVDLRDRIGFEQYLESRFRAQDQLAVTRIDMPEHPSPAVANPTVNFTRSSIEGRYQGAAKVVCSDGLILSVVTSSQPIVR